MEEIVRDKLGRWVEHRHGVPWYLAPIPPKRHIHKMWTKGRPYPYELWIFYRCSCGALKREGEKEWKQINSRRKGTVEMLWL